MKIRTALWLLFVALPLWLLKAESLSPHLRFFSGAVNAVWIEQNDARIAVYGVRDHPAPSGSTHLLLTHSRRDVLAGVGSLDAATDIIAPAAARDFFEKPDNFWKEFVARRFHDYAQQSTKILAEPIGVDRWVREGDALRLAGLKIGVIATPGYTRGAVSYWAEVDGVKVVFTGDLIYGDGKILDLYSFQDAIPEARVRGYHGYGGRLGALVSSLEKVKALDPGMIIPARGPVIRDPGAAIDRLIERVRALYRNYLSTSALHWYFKEQRMRICGERVLGKGAEIELMPYAVHLETPDWIFGYSTTRLLISDDGFGFLLDCGNPRVIDEVKGMLRDGVIKKVEGIFVTHIHDDHTDAVQAAAEAFACPVYATVEYEDVLEHPGAYHLPALTAHGVREVHGMKDGERLSWREFELTFRYFPGQTFYHGALWVKKPGETPIFFVGDSFAPSGIDDYCVLNRNLVHEDTGYLLCLEKLRRIQGDYWLINEHIPYVFRFSEKEMRFLETRYRARVKILKELFPWDDPNYGIDEQWAVFYPYGVRLKPGASAQLEVRVTNHSPVDRSFRVTPRGWDGVAILGPHESAISLGSRETGAVRIRVQAPEAPGHYLVTADVESGDMRFRDWVEAMILVE